MQQNRRDVLRLMAGAASFLTTGACAQGDDETGNEIAADLTENEGMRHRSYRGKMLYLTNDVGEMGREWFHVTVQPDGSRTMRATCEMDDDRLLRDVVVTVDGNWYPRDAFVRLSIEEKLVGTSWFNFAENKAECQGYSAEDGRIVQDIPTETRTRFFGAHQLHGDAWACAVFEHGQRNPSSAPAINFSSSHLPNGGSGPLLEPTPPGFTRIERVGKERVEVAAGSFETNHYQFFVSDFPPIDIWTLGTDFIPVRLRWDLLNQDYELVELDGDTA